MLHVHHHHTTYITFPSKTIPYNLLWSNVGMWEMTCTKWKLSCERRIVTHTEPNNGNHKKKMETYPTHVMSCHVISHRFMFIHSIHWLSIRVHWAVRVQLVSTFTRESTDFKRKQTISGHRRRERNKPQQRHPPIYHKIRRTEKLSCR